ncbi:MAG: SAM-dependent methyltransferase [Chitinophagaceae bacterium BSSC1]|nr:MAG: SAM-dependent methyltransferase [Chitinophagaceae bacterium BSSC1]
MEELNQAYWNERYEQGNTGWNIGTISSPLKDYFDQLSQKNLRILIPGGGNGHEAEYLLSLGFSNITVLDIAPIALEKLALRFLTQIGKTVHLILGDFFEHQGQYDLIIEQTFFCALDPSLRQAYVEKMAALLSNNGRLSGLLFDTQFPAGPPFGGNKQEYQELFSTHFNFKTLAPCYNSIPQRMGNECFIIATKKQADF